MTSDLFFEQLKKQYSEGLPFVVYRKPQELKIKGLFQKDTKLYQTKDLTESGFVFAPFSGVENSVLIPTNSSIVLESDYPPISKTAPSFREQDTPQTAMDQHIKLVQKGLAAIDSGDLIKVVLSRKEVLPIEDLDSIDLFQRLLNTYDTAFVYLWFHPKEGLWLGATPESLLSLKNNRLTTMSLAGTKLSNDTKGIVWGKKEKEEQQLVTDFIKKQLDPTMSNMAISEARTVKAGHLSHLQTKISGTINNTDLIMILKKLHPTPAICGLPRSTAKEFILENENYDREFYTGFLGELNLLESTKRNTKRRNTENDAYGSILKVSNLYVNLRCVQIKNGKAHIYVGGGITKDSVPENEWYETINKANTMKKVL